MSIEPLSDYDLLPTYMRVAEDLRSKLGTLGFEFGSFLPGEFEMAAQYNLSRGTIRRALGILESEGLVSRQPGRGTLILPPETHNPASVGDSGRRRLIEPAAWARHTDPSTESAKSGCRKA